MPYDNTNNNVSSMAMASTSAFIDETVNVKVFDQNGNVLKTDSIAIPGGHHIAFIIAQKWPELANTQGSLVFRPANVIANVSIMGLRFASIATGFTVTTLPVMQHFDAP